MRRRNKPRNFQFLLSGFKCLHEQRAVKEKIEALGGILQDVYKSTVTHLIWKAPTRSEKFLSVCAAGKWILKPNFVEDSFLKKKWQVEELYEYKWSDAPRDSPAVLKDLYAAPRRHRLCKQTVFYKWRVVFFNINDDILQGYKRIVSAGGGEVRSFDLSVLCDEKLQDTFTHVFVDNAQKEGISKLITANILCIHVNFVRDSILTDTPLDASQFRVPGYDPVFDPYESTKECLSSHQRMNGKTAVMRTEKVWNTMPQHKRPLRTILSPKQQPSSKHKRVKRETTNVTPKQPAIKKGPLDNYVIRLPVVKMEPLPKTATKSSGKNPANCTLTSASGRISTFVNNSEKKDSSETLHRNPNIRNPLAENRLPDNQNCWPNILSNTENGNVARVLFDDDKCEPEIKTKSLNMDTSILTVTTKGPQAQAAKIIKNRLHQFSYNSQNISHSLVKKGENGRCLLKELRRNLEALLAPVNSENKFMKISSEEKNPAAYEHFVNNKQNSITNLSVDVSSSTVQAVKLGNLTSLQSSPSCSNKPRSIISKSENVRSSSKIFQELAEDLANLTPTRAQSQSVNSSLLKRPAEKISTARVLFDKDEHTPVKAVTHSSSATSSELQSFIESHSVCSPESLSVPTKCSEVNSVKCSPDTQNKCSVSVNGKNSATPHLLKILRRKLSLVKMQKSTNASSAQLPKAPTPNAHILSENIECKSPTQRANGLSTHHSPHGQTGESTATCSDSISALKTNLRKLALSTSWDKRAKVSLSEIPEAAILQAAVVTNTLKVKRYVRQWSNVLSRYQENSGKGTQASDRFRVAFETFTEDEEWMSAIDEVTQMTSGFHYPAPSVLQDLLKMILDAPNIMVLNAATKALNLVLTLHPPSTYSMRQYYLNIFSQNAPTSPWMFISDVIRDSIAFTYEDNDLTVLRTRNVRSRIVLLEFFQKLFELDFASFVTSSQNPADDLSFANRQPLLVQLVWGTGNPKAINSNCRRLLQYFVDCVKHGGMFKVLNTVQKLVSYLLEYCRLSESKSVISFVKPGSSAYTLSLGLGAAVLKENLNEKQTAFLLDSLDASWAKLIVSELLLDQMGHSEASDFNSGPFKPISLQKIVSHFMTLTPSSSTLDSSFTRPPLTPLKSGILTTPLKSDSTPRRLSASPIAISPRFAVNKRNRKGETPLHLACISNNVERLRHLLAVPGIDANARDNCGWTPLHEACNHGHFECVVELLKYKPLKTIDSYYSEEGQPPTQELDVTVSACDNITPLHDAVIGNHVDIAEALLTFGGSKLLDAKDSDGKTPLDLASSSEMKVLLKEFPSRFNNEAKESLCKVLTPNEFFTGNNLERYVVLVRQLVQSYLEVHSIRELWSHICGNDLYSSPTKPDCLLPDAYKARIIHDLNLFSNMNSHISHFEDHILQDCQDNLCDTIWINIASLQLSIVPV